MNHGTTRNSSTGGHAAHSAQSGGTSHAGMNHGRRTAASSAHAGHAAAGGQTHSAAHASERTGAAGSHAGHENRAVAAAGHAGAHAAASGTTNGHAGMNHGASGHAVPAARPVDEGTRKLLDLAGELVRDPAVQREIQQDPALREAWSDPAVRRVVTKQP